MPFVAARKTADAVKEKAAKGVGYAKRKAGEISSTVRERVPSLSKAAKEKATEGIGYAKRKAGAISSTVQERVGPSLSKASKELPGTIQGISGAIGGAAGGAKSAAMSRWEWAKKEVEGRRK